MLDVYAMAPSPTTSMVSWVLMVGRLLHRCFGTGCIIVEVSR